MAHRLRVLTSQEISVKGNMKICVCIYIYMIYTLVVHIYIYTYLALLGNIPTTRSYQSKLLYYSWWFNEIISKLFAALLNWADPKGASSFQLHCERNTAFKAFDHVLIGVLSIKGYICTFWKPRGVTHSYQMKKNLSWEKGLMFFLKNNTARVCQIHAPLHRNSHSLGPWHCQWRPRKALNSRERGAWWVLVAGSHLFFVSSWHRGLKMDGWKTILSFWVSAYFQGANC